MIKALIIDDEEAPREILDDLLRNFCPAVQVAGMAKDTFEAEEMIKELQPNLLFLDVEMPRRNGIEFLKEQTDINYHVIFITAYNRYAIEAIKLSALDYLVKPIDIKELVAAVHRVSEEELKKDRINNLLGNAESDTKKIALCHSDGIDFVPTDEILYAEADGSYSTVHLKSGGKIMISKTLKTLEDPLISNGFFRSHKSFLVNLSEIVRYDKEGYLNISNGAKLQVSRGKKDEIIRLISK